MRFQVHCKESKISWLKVGQNCIQGYVATAPPDVLFLTSMGHFPPALDWPQMPRQFPPSFHFSGAKRKQIRARRGSTTLKSSSRCAYPQAQLSKPGLASSPTLLPSIVPTGPQQGSYKVLPHPSEKNHESQKTSLCILPCHSTIWPYLRGRRLQ